MTRTEPKTIDRKSANYRAQRNKRATLRTRIREIQTRMVRKAWKRLKINFPESTLTLEAERRRISPGSAVGGSVGPKTRAKPDRRKSHAQREQKWKRDRDTEKERELYREKRRQGILAKFRKAKWIKDTQKDMIKERILNRAKLDAEKRKLGSM